MNWNGGGRARHTKAAEAVKALQKKHFAQCRQRKDNAPFADSMRSLPDNELPASVIDGPRKRTAYRDEDLAFAKLKERLLQMPDWVCVRNCTVNQHVQGRRASPPTPIRTERSTSPVFSEVSEQRYLDTLHSQTSAPESAFTWATSDVQEEKIGGPDLNNRQLVLNEEKEVEPLGQANQS